jgi:thioredoxin reductase (NADPH)
MIGCQGERELRGMGVSYCATCDANFFKNMKVAVIGGGNTALEEALFLTKYAASVTIIHRRQELRGAKILQNRVKENEKIDFMLDSVVEEIIGSGYVEAIKVKNVVTNQIETIPMDGVFVFVGQKPNTDGFEGLLKQNDRGYLLTDDEMRTDIEGVFAAGDIRQKSLRQVVTATGDGAIAASNAIKFIEG